MSACLINDFMRIALLKAIFRDYDPDIMYVAFLQTVALIEMYL